MSQSPLELRHLQTLAALAATGSLGRAADRVFVTQSALSHQIKALETHYGTPLFERGSKPLRFTQPGERLVALAREVLRLTADAERDVAQWVSGRSGQLRIAVECHTCFDWLMPAMDRFRAHWPEVELDLVSGFQADAGALVAAGAADFGVIHDHPAPRAGCVAEPLFRYEILAIVSPQHRLARLHHLTPGHFAGETLISYPVDDERLDVMRHFLEPAGVRPAARRSAELTVAILQLVASGRGIAALPAWSVAPYLDKGYVIGRPLGRDGLHGELYALVPESLAGKAYLQDFLQIIRSGTR